MDQPFRRVRSWRGIRSVAGQIFALQVVVVMVLVASAAIALPLQSRSDAERGARQRSLAVAAAVASSPAVERAVTAGRTSAALQQQARLTRQRSDVDFVVVMSPTGIRHTHANAAQIGRHYIGSITEAQRGGIVTETTTGTLGPSVRTVVPVTGPEGKVVGLVSAGITVDHVSGIAGRQAPIVLGATGPALAAATGGTALIGRRLSRQTQGLGPVQMTRMYEHHDAVLHSVREGVIIVDPHGCLLLANDEARRLLALPEGMSGRPVAELGLPPRAEQLLLSGTAATDQVIEIGDRLLAASQRRTAQSSWPGGAGSPRCGTPPNSAR